MLTSFRKLVRGQINALSQRHKVFLECDPVIGVVSWGVNFSVCARQHPPFPPSRFVTPISRTPPHAFWGIVHYAGPLVRAHRPTYRHMGSFLTSDDGAGRRAPATNHHGLGLQSQLQGSCRSANSTMIISLVANLHLRKSVVDLCKSMVRYPATSQVTINKSGVKNSVMPDKYTLKVNQQSRNAEQQEYCVILRFHQFRSVPC